MLCKLARKFGTFNREMCLSKDSLIEISGLPKGQIISKCLLGVIVWTKIATKKFDNFCPDGQIKKKTLYYIEYPIINIKKCLYFFDLTTRAEIVKFFRCYFGPNDDTKKTF